jgi:ATP-binding protein involved in chromosome partitioning
VVSETDVRQALHSVEDPAIGKPIDELGMVGAVRISGDEVAIDLLLTVSGHPDANRIRDAVGEAVAKVPGVGSVQVQLDVMSDEQRAEVAEGLQREIPFRRPDSRTAVIGVSSGKGGVGKSTVTTNLAAALTTLGHRVGVLDADIWGFSIPRMFGLRGRRPVAFNGMIMPLDRDGVKVISIGFFLETEEEPVMWRGPMLHKALEQFLSDVYWGDELEFLLIDLPPGTGDISISLAGFLPDMGMVVVTTPQPVAQKVAERAANMSGKVRLRNLGVIENMSGVVCAHCGETTDVFGAGGGRLLAETLKVPLLAEIPLTAEMRELADAGEPYVWRHPGDAITERYMEAARELTRFRPKRRLKVSQAGGR